MTLNFDEPLQFVGTAMFQPGNDIQYGQDFAWYRGVPAGVKFRVFDSGNLWKLEAPGYGDLDGNGYGNGALYISKESVPLAPTGTI